MYKKRRDAPKYLVALDMSNYTWFNAVAGLAYYIPKYHFDMKYFDLRSDIEVTLEVSQLEIAPEHPVAPLGHVCAPASGAETRESAATSHAETPLLNAHVFLNLTVRGSIVFEISRICATQQISMAI